jgi:hypothetical protein
MIPARSSQWTERPLVLLALARESPFHPDRAGGAAGGLLAPQHPSIALPIYLDHRHIDIKASEFLRKSLTLRRDKAPMQLLFEPVEIRNRLPSTLALLEKVVELVKSALGSRQRLTDLRCLHGVSLRS